MRVLHLDAGKDMRGGQWQALRLVTGLREEGVECTLLARAGSPLFEAARRAGCRVAPLSWGRVATLARRHDLVHAHDAHSHTLAALAGGAPLVVARRVAFGPGGAGLWPALSRWKYSRPARYIAVSEFVKSVLVARGVPAEKIAAVYDGVPLLEVAGGAETGGVLAPANAGDPRKGAPLAVEAARQAGVELKLSSDLERDLPGAAAFVYITHSEGLGSGALLAMSAGVPVVASRVGGLPEVIRHGENGLLVENAPAAIAAALRELLDDPARARHLGQTGRRSVMEHFTVERMVRRTLEVYRQVCP
ncbi:MAG: glycosyltransferase family 4 protein [Bryobacteraceae bacterium]|jgi:glycosyltransferase involved in cell wall biosynthesis